MKKRDAYVEQAVKIGAKLKGMNKDFDMEDFLQVLVPPSSWLKNKIERKYEESQTLLCEKQPHVNVKNCFDSDLIEALKKEFNNFQNDYEELLKNTDPSNCASEMSLLSKDTEPERCAKVKQLKKPCRESKVKCKESKELDGESLCLQQVINPGEMSKIFVQKNRTDVVRSFEEKPNFDDNLETIYIYRSKHF